MLRLECLLFPKFDTLKFVCFLIVRLIKKKIQLYIIQEVFEKSNLI